MSASAVAEETTNALAQIAANLRAVTNDGMNPSVLAAEHSIRLWEAELADCEENHKTHKRALKNFISTIDYQRKHTAGAVSYGYAAILSHFA